MAVFESRLTDTRDYERVNDYLFDLSERLKIYFRTLTPEDNFSPEAYLKYEEKNGKIAVLEKTTDGLQTDYENLEKETKSQLQILDDKISLKVTKGDLTNQLNLEPGDIKLSGNRLEISGENLNLDGDGNLMYRGEVIATAGRIAGFEIEPSKSDPNTKLLSGSNTSKIKAESVSSDDWLSFDEATVSGGADFSNAEIGLDGSSIESDKSTIGTARAYNDLVADGQVTCKSCYTQRDGKTWSDRRLKEGIREISETEATVFVMGLKPCTYHFHGETKIAAGFIAQDIEELEKAAGAEYGLVRKKDGKLMLRYAGLIPFLTAVLRRQQREIRELCSQTS